MTINVKPPPAVVRRQAAGDDLSLGERRPSQYHAPLEPSTVVALIEIRHARLRLALAENELCWIYNSVKSGLMTAEGGIALLDDVMDRFAEGGQP